MRKKIAIALLFVLNCSFARAWQFYNQSDATNLEKGFVLLEPDNWGRSDLKELKQKGIVPLAWLNLAYIEDNRTTSLNIKKHDYFIQGPYSTKGKKLALFYKNTFKSILKSRVQEYMLKGFCGLVLAHSNDYDLISNSPINRVEMVRLVEFLSDETLKCNSNALIFLHNSQRLWPEAADMPYISGVIEEGMFYTVKGRTVKRWHRQSRLEGLRRLIKAGKMVLIAEDARTLRRRDYVKKHSEQEGFDFAFGALPLKFERNPQNGKTR